MPSRVHELMSICWRQIPDERPRFGQLVVELAHLLGQSLEPESDEVVKALPLSLSTEPVLSSAGAKSTFRPVEQALSGIWSHESKTPRPSNRHSRTTHSANSPRLDTNESAVQPSQAWPATSASHVSDSRPTSDSSSLLPTSASFSSSSDSSSSFPSPLPSPSAQIPVSTLFQATQPSQAWTQQSSLRIHSKVYPSTTSSSNTIQ
ncbi:unnamed protein product [Protopolystoma xenopodis]|uniref:Uncharacterized protein n=1 Tax=Protopolystoma xenopodis TaxID=117903 RepID=A0A3S5AHG0_9PLAT|nr:unnamed protein product [Protopolystoma xenopodis]